jgi:hypothetical protein
VAGNVGVWQPAAARGKIIPMKPATAIDLAHRLLHHFGWSVGETAFRLPNGSGYWQVDASRDGQVIIASAHSQAKAWWECCRMAGVVEQNG